MVTAAGEKEGVRIQVSDRMEARLSGQNFQITAITPEEQAITSSDITQWNWDITPKSAGQHHLHLTVTALFNVDIDPAKRAVRTFDKTIEVYITWTQSTSVFLGKNWQWLWTALLVPVAGWFWKKHNSRVARARQQPASQLGGTTRLSTLNVVMHLGQSKLQITDSLDILGEKWQA